MQTFTMHRTADESGVSGVGLVLEGVMFSNHKVVVTWLGKGEVTASSVAVYDSYKDFEAIHITSHPNNGTEILWQSDTIKYVKETT